MRSDRGRQRFLAAGWLVSAGVMAVTFRIWQLHVREVEERAEEAERTRDEAAQRRAMEERLRIARELHDSLTHSISVVQVQAGVAVHLARKRGEDPPSALMAIQEAGADAARELRATLTVLRSDEDGDSSGLGQLDGLVARAQTAGLPVTVTITGVARALPPDVDRAAYRIVQEALTNVSRHAGQASASVHLHYSPDALSVQVADDGNGSNGNGSTGSKGNRSTGSDSSGSDGSDFNGGEINCSGSDSSGSAIRNGCQPSGPGLGLLGMRERVSALGGVLQAGPQDGGGFQVHAELPARAPA